MSTLQRGCPSLRDPSCYHRIRIGGLLPCRLSRRCLQRGAGVLVGNNRREEQQESDIPSPILLIRRYLWGKPGKVSCKRSMSRWTPVSTTSSSSELSSDGSSTSTSTSSSSSSTSSVCCSDSAIISVSSVRACGGSWWISKSSRLRLRVAVAVAVAMECCCGLDSAVMGRWANRTSAGAVEVSAGAWKGEGARV